MQAFVCYEEAFFTMKSLRPSVFFSGLPSDMGMTRYPITTKILLQLITTASQRQFDCLKEVEKKMSLLKKINTH